MPRLFISHSSQDNSQAFALHQWLAANGWPPEEVFIDEHSLGAGDRWRDALRKSRTASEAVLFLASPASIDSVACVREVQLAKDMGKEVIIAVAYGLSPNDPRLQRFGERHIVDLFAEPRNHVERIDSKGELSETAFNAQALDSIKRRLSELGTSPSSFPWPSDGRPVASPFLGLRPFSEEDAGVFFGRDAEIIGALADLKTVRRQQGPRLVIIESGSGTGKSSFLRAGLWPRLTRNPDFLPLPLLRPAFGILHGQEGLERSLVAYFQKHGSLRDRASILSALHPSSAADTAAFIHLMRDVLALASTRLGAAASDDEPTALVIGIDQMEEILLEQHAGESQLFLELMANLLQQSSPEINAFVIATARSDSVPDLLRKFATMSIEAPKAIYLPPLAPAAFADVIREPLRIYSERVQQVTIEPSLVQAMVDDATHGADGLPLLEFMLARLFDEYGHSNRLDLSQYQAMGGIAGPVELWVNHCLQQLPASSPLGTPLDRLRNLLIPHLVNIDVDGNPFRRRSQLSALSFDDDLIGALISFRLLHRYGDIVEISHDAILRHCSYIRAWIEEERDALLVIDDLEKCAQLWEASKRSPDYAVHRGSRLENAKALLPKPQFRHRISDLSKDYLGVCEKLLSKSRWRREKTEEYIYDAFISYSRQDIGICSWIYNRLVEFELTREAARAAQRQTGTPISSRPFRRVFRDVRELTPGGVLDKKLISALESAKHLILLCSVNAAASEWVNKEVSRFLQRRGIDNVIPVWVNGDYKAGTDRCCLPQCLLDLPSPPLAIDARDEDRLNDVHIQLVSGMLKVPRRALIPSMSEVSLEAVARLKRIQRLSVAGVAISVGVMLCIILLIGILLH